MKPFVDPRLYVTKTTHKGWGIFTKAKIKKGTITEACIPTKIKYKDIKKGFEIIASYIYTGFPYSDLGTGFGSCINHGAKPNVGIYGSEEGFIVFHAVRDIEANEEICMDYGVKDWGKPEKNIVFDAKKIKDYIYIDKRLYLDYNDKPISKKVKHTDPYLKKTLNNNLLYNVFAKANIKKDTTIEMAMCAIFEENKNKIKKDSSLKNLYFYNDNKMILPFGFSNLYAINKNKCNVDIVLNDKRLSFITNKDIEKDEKLFIKSKTF